ncbi:MAG: heme exporter protein CcmB [Dehalococcoidia bacterium]|nr:heme exporter protein CcmB [Dehalococcoidia bacterium]MBL7166048.1 heme exporter protein CcmB [Dehalococcoidales bacterium]
MSGMFARVFTIFWKDVLSEIRTKEIVTAVLVFALLVLVIFNFAFDPASGTTARIAPGILWVAFTFAGILGLNRVFAIEKENSSLAGLRLCPVDRMVIFWGKLAGSFTFMLVIAAVITPIFLVLFNLPLFLPRLALIIVLATLGFTSVGTLFSALAMNIRARDIMLPILFLPLVVPVIIGAVETTTCVLAGGPWSDMLTWLEIMIAFDIIYLVVATLMFEFVIEE